MRVEYSEPLAAGLYACRVPSEHLAAWIFLDKVRTGHMRYIGWMDVLVRVQFFLEKMSWTLGKAKSR